MALYKFRIITIIINKTGKSKMWTRIYKSINILLLPTLQ